MFHENHQHYLLSQFHSIDKLLSEAVADLRPADDGRLFATHVADAAIDQRQVLSDYVAQLRFLLRRFMQVQNFIDAHRPVSAVSSFRVALSFAGTAVEELRPTYLRGYGEVDAESLAAAERLVADLKSLLGHMTNYLDRGTGDSIASRLAKLDATVDGSDLLRELDRMIATHGLVELRAPLEQLLERATHPRFEIAVFGRVNSGKTSLLNWWLGQPLLPTGVTPVTAVPNWFVRDEIPRVRVTIAGSPSFDTSLEQLAAHGTKEDAPSNHKRVLDIEIRVPAVRLVQGVCLVDTPGLGSLATGGTAHTLEYLPRCDLGVLLIEAGGVISREDIDVARAIIDSGAELVIALSKADRLSAPELAHALEYARIHLGAERHFSIEVRPISVSPTHVALADIWFQHELAPRLAVHREEGARAFRRKITVLRETVVALLEARLRSKATGGAGVPSPSPVAISDASSRAHAAIEHERGNLSSMRFPIEGQIDQVVAAAADALAHGWIAPLNDATAVATEVRAASARSTAAAADRLAERLKTLRQDLQDILRDLPIGLATTAKLPPPRGRPSLDTATISLPQNLKRPRGTGALRPVIRAAARQRLELYSHSSLGRPLGTYGDALRHRASQYVDELASPFDAAYAVQGGKERIEAATEPSDDGANILHGDLKRLQ